MNRRKKLFAILLSVMLVMTSLIPNGIVHAVDGGAPAAAAELTAGETVKAAKAGTVLAFTSDVHNKSNNTAANRLDTWIKKIVGLYGGIDAMAFGGDMADAFASSSTFWTYTQAGMDKLSDNRITGVYTTGNHEHSPGSFSSSSTNATQKAYKVNTQGAEGDNYRIYCLGSNSSSSSYANQVTSLSSYLDSVGNDKPIFIITHFPLHYYSSYRTTASASNVIDVLNDAVNIGGKKIVFLWGHNHTEAPGETHYDEVFAPGSELQYGSSSRDKKTIQFYYAAAGCISDTEYGTGSGAVEGKGLVVTINDEDELSFTYYNEYGTNVTEGGTFSEVVATGLTINDVTETGEDGQLVVVENPTVATGKTLQLNVTFEPFGASGKVAWSSSDETVATVDKNGKVMGISEGTATITATLSGSTRKGGTLASIDVTVGPRGAEPSYVLTNTLEPGKNYIITNGNSGTVHALTNSNGSVASTDIEVDGNTITTDNADIVFTAEGSGTTITDLVNDGHYLAVSRNGSGYNYTYSVSLETQARNIAWTYSNDNYLSSYRSTSSTSSIYVYYSSSNGYSASNTTSGTSSRAVYLFVEQEGSGGGDDPTPTGKTVDITPNATNIPEETIKIDVDETLTINVTNSSNRNGYDFTATFTKGGVAEIQGSSTVNIGTGATGQFVVKGLTDGTVDITISNNNSNSERRGIIHLTVGNGGGDDPTPTEEDRYVSATSFVADKDYIVAVDKGNGKVDVLKNAGNGSLGSVELSLVSENGIEYVTTADTSIIWKYTTSTRNRISNSSRYLTINGSSKALETDTSGNYAITYNANSKIELTYPGSSSGNIYYVKYNNGTFSATSANAVNDAATIKLFVKYEEVIPVTGVSLDKNTITLETGETETLTATISPDNATNKQVTWTSSDSSVATVSNGVVTAVGAGTATITASAGEGVTATCSVTVTEPDPVRYVEVHELQEGKNYIIAVTKDDNSVYVISNSSGAVATAELAITPASGDNTAFIETSNAYVVWKYNGGDRHYMTQGSYYLNITNSGNARNLTINNTQAYGVGYAGNHLYLQNYSATSGNKYYIAFSNSTFSATASNASTSAASIILFEEYTAPASVTGVALDKDSMEVNVGGTKKLTATVEPANAGNKTVIWESSDPSIATVDNSGNVTGVAEGTATITVTTDEGSKTATCEIIVTKQKTYVIIINNHALSTGISSDQYISSNTYHYHGLAGVSYDVDTVTDDSILWVITETDGGYSIQSLDGKYLNAYYTATTNPTGCNADLRLESIDDNATPDVWVLDDGVNLDSWKVEGSHLKSTNASSTASSPKYLSEETGTNNGSSLFSIRSLANSDTSIIEEAGDDETHEHTYGTPTYSWSDDNSSCTATAVCTGCEEGTDGHSVTETVTAVYAVTTPATCTEAGSGTYTAEFENELFEQQIKTAEIAKIAHTVVIDEAVDATCTESGLTEGSHCSVCNEVIIAQEVVPALGHNYGEATYTWAEDNSTCTAAMTCSRCMEETEGHTVTETVETAYEEITAATCTSVGTGTYTATFTNTAFTAQTKTVEIAKIAHTVVIDEAVDATCTETGLTEGSHCSVCNEVIVAQEVVPALGHDLEHHEAKAATCTEVGWDAYDTCTRCDYTTYAEIPATGHSYGEPVWTWAEDYSSASAKFTCSKCGDVQTVTDSKTESAQGTGDHVGYTGYTASVSFGDETYIDTQYRINQYTLTFKDGDEVITTITQDFGTVVTAPADLTKAFYTFNGWGTEVPATMPAENMTFTAQWTAVEGYYLIGSITGEGDGWELLENYKLTVNPDNNGEYSIGTTLAVGDKIKVVKAVGETITDYYPDTNHNYNGITGDYSVDADHSGGITLYFRPDGNSDSYWQPFGGYFYIAKDHIITVESQGNGTAAAYRSDSTDPATNAPIGKLITVEFTPAEGYQLDKIELWKTNGGTAAEQQVEGTTFTMPDYDVIIKVYFEPITWEFVEFTWTGNDNAGYTAAVANYKGSDDSTKSVEADVTSETTAATCEASGQTVYTATVTAEASLDGEPHNDSKTVEIEALGHDWNDPVYVWSADNSSVTATRTCKRDTNHIETETVNTTSAITTEATCTTDGIKTYTSAAFTNSAFAVQTKTEAIPATDHAYGAVTYTWTADNSKVTATRICANDASHVETETVDTTSEVTKPATCETKGETTYTAAFTNSAFATQTKVVDDIPVLGHAYGEVTYTWADDNSKVTATRTCANDASHVETETVDTTSVVTTEATCTTDGVKTYTSAAFTNSAFTVQSKTEAIPATGHSWAYVDITWTAKEGGGYTAVANYKCDKDNTHTNSVNAEITSESTDATCTTAGTVTYTASVSATDSLDSEAHSDVKTETGTPLGHDWNDPVYTWTNDNRQVTATHTCKRDASHSETETVSATSAVTTEAGCETNGVRTWTSAVFTNAAFSVQTKTEAIPALGHDLSKTEAVAATCETSGNSAYWTCAVCGKYFSDEEGKTEIAKDSWVIAATGHDWEAAYTWASDFKSVTAVFTCKHDSSHTDTVTAAGDAISVDTTEPTATTPGVRTYTATITFDGKTFTTSTTETIPATGVTVSGTVVSFCTGNDEHTDEDGVITLTLTKAGESQPAYTATANTTGTTPATELSAQYSFTGVTEGAYTLTVAKAYHATRTYEVTVAAGTPVTQNAKIHLMGDITGDGKVTTIDSQKVTSHAKGVTLLVGYEIACGDITGDGKVTTIDSQKVTSHAKGVTLIW